MICVYGCHLLIDQNRKHRQSHKKKMTVIATGMMLRNAKECLGLLGSPQRLEESPEELSSRLCRSRGSCCHPNFRHLTLRTTKKWISLALT